jgi:hypothetical protein
MRELLHVVMEEKVGVVAGAVGATKDDALLAVNLELMLLPLEGDGRSEGRVLGAMGPMAAPYWLGAKAIGPLTLGMFRHIGPAVEATLAPRLVPAEGRLKHGLTVYDGGKVV